MSEIQSLLEAGQSFHRRGELEHANACYQQVLQLDANSSLAWHLSSEIALAAGLPDAALPLAERALELEADEIRYRTGLGNILAHLGRYEEARSLFESVLELDPYAQDVYINLGRLFVAEGRPDDAIAVVMPLAADPGALGVLARRLMAQCHFELGRITEALRSIKARLPGEETRSVLHVGCGGVDLSGLPEPFQGGGWKEIRLDIDPKYKPDVIASVADMTPVADQSVDAVYASHNIEHLFHHEVPLALAEFFRVLRPGGFAMVRVPDLQAACAMVAEDRLYDTAYMSAAGPIAPIDMIYSYRKFLLDGNVFMLHKTGFTASSLRNKFTEAGFEPVLARAKSFELMAVAIRPH